MRRISFQLCAVAVFIVVSLTVRADDFISPIPETVDYDKDKASLGNQLFHDTRLSGDGSLSCASCHVLDRHGIDLNNPSIGVQKSTLPRNSPTVYNSRFNFKHNWDGKADTLQSHALLPLKNPKVMGANIDQLISELSSDTDYQKAFKKAYDGEISEATITSALAEFQSSLITPNAPFDQFLKGDEEAISAQQKRGYQLFKSYGCVGCHQGINVGGNLLQRFGAVNDIDNRNNAADTGRFKITGDEADKFVFRVPSLRLAAHTPPYFHDGSAATLSEAIDIMARYQLGRALPEQDKQDIISFIESLAGTAQGAE